MPILKQVESLATEVAELRQQLKQHLDVAQQHNTAQIGIEHTSALVQLQNLVQADIENEQLENETGIWRYVRDGARYLVLPFVLLLAAHGVIVYLYELRPFYLHLASLLIPLPFGFLLFARRARNGVIWSSLFACIALLAVLGMNVISGILEDMPMYPNNATEWRESFEFALSILCSALTGMLIGRIVYAAVLRNREARFTTLQRALVSSSKIFGQSLSPESVRKWSEYISRLGILGTTLTSIYTGLKDVL
jgi:uncharacterized integral membrane protein